MSVRSRLADVAKLADVHPATASRALNERTRHLVSAETLERVLAAADELHYLPNPMARSLASSRSNTIGVVIGDLTVPLFAHLLRGIDEVTTAAGYATLFVDTHNDPARELAQLRTLEARHVDGLIVTTSVVGDPDGTGRFAKVAPVVNLLRACPNGENPEVISNDDRGMRLIVDHLVGLGHTRIAHIAGPATVSTGVARRHGYRNAMTDHGLPEDDSLVVTIDRIDAEQGRAAAIHLLDTTDCTAIVGFSDLVTFGVLKELRSRKIHCPEQISVVGYSDVPSAELMSPALTTVAVDHHAMGAEAARLMLGILDDPAGAAARSVQFPVELVVRESTGPCRVMSS
nr:LacI family DNA-binding transcriptional regulator [Gordonia sp. NB41Y]EMP13300.2 hypothetical protein ISGA_880 [Gordonia sp. NB41Y]